MNSLSFKLALLLSASSASAVLGEGPGKTVATLEFVKDHSTPLTVKLPAGTRKVMFAVRKRRPPLRQHRPDVGRWSDVEFPRR